MQSSHNKVDRSIWSTRRKIGYLHIVPLKCKMMAEVINQALNTVAEIIELVSWIH